MEQPYGAGPEAIEMSPKRTLEDTLGRVPKLLRLRLSLGVVLATLGPAL